MHDIDDHKPSRNDNNLQERQAAARLGREAWTVAIDLTTIETSDGHEKGTNNQLRQLEALAANTAGTPVSLLVQTEHATYQSTNSKTIKDSFGNSLEGKADARGVVDRYLIRDGMVTNLGETNSRGTSQNLTDLLQTAKQVAPSEHLGLILQSHGGGRDGIQTDIGSASLDNLRSAIDRGLANSGHDELDFLDFDSCSMGDLSVLSAMRHSASNVVASSETEGAGGTDVDGQKLVIPILDLLSHPSMSGEQFAQSFIVAADHGANDTHDPNPQGPSERTGTSTLASYDMSQYPQLNSALNDFGSALAETAKHGHNLEAIGDMIAAVPLVSQQDAHVEGKPITQNRDLRIFADFIVEASRSGWIQDPDHKLEEAASQFRWMERSFTTGYHGEDREPYNVMGGLTTFLPDAKVRSARNANAIRERDASFAAAALPDAPGWSQFMEVLRTHPAS